MRACVACYLLRNGLAAVADVAAGHRYGAHVEAWVETRRVAVSQAEPLLRGSCAHTGPTARGK